MNEAWLEKTERYFNNEMNAEDRLLFEAELKKNDELSFYVNLYKEIETSMRSSQKDMEQEAALKASLNNLSAIYFKKDDTNIANDTKELAASRSGNIQSFQNKKQRRKKTWSIFAIAAGITGIIMVCVIFYWNNAKKNTTTAVNIGKVDTSVTSIKTDTNHLQKNIPPNLAQKNADSNAAEHKPQTVLTKQKQETLFMSYFKPDDVPEITDSRLDDAFAYYSKHNYTDAAEEFSTADINVVTRGLETDPKLTAFYKDYYAGLSYLANGQATKAIPKLKSAISKSRGSLKIKAEWYLSLSYLKNDEIANAKELLTKISSGVKENKYSLKAAKLRDQLAAK